MLTDPEIRGMFKVAYAHVKKQLGYFPPPKLVIMKKRDRAGGDFYYVQGGEIYVNASTRDPMYESLKHELTHAFIDYIDTHHRGYFTECAVKVGAIYAR